jgi:hypothetical protein
LQRIVKNPGARSHGILALAITLLVGLACPATSIAAEAASAKTFAIVRIPEADAPKIDGHLDEAVWQRAAVVSDLAQFQQNIGEPTERSEFYVMYDKDMLYIGARLFESEPDKVEAKVLRSGERLNNEDKIAIILDTFNDKRNGYRFEVNVNGVRDDALYLDTTQTQWEWDGIYFADSARDEKGWTSEMAIPFKTLSFDPASGTWGINFGRLISRKNERDGWVHRNRAQNPSSSGEMTGLLGADQGLGLDVVPSVSLRRDREFVAGTTEDSVEPSLDMYYKVTSGLNAALTFNTDFSATEVDDRQVNLSQFSLFFPEKRGFFLRDSDIFEFGRLKGGDISFSINPTFSRAALENGRPFFSRSIGLSATGAPVDLLAGTKVSGRIGGFNVGALAIRQDQTDTVDAQNLFVGRLVANVLSESSLGLIATKGNPRSNLDNSVVGTDFRYVNNRLPGNRSLEGELWYEKSDTEGLAGDDAAYGARLRSPNNTGWRGGLGFKELEANFNPAMGFVNRKGVRNYTAEAGYTKRFPTGITQGFYSGVDFEQYTRTADDSLQSRLVTYRLMDFYGRKNDQFKARIYQNEEVLRTPFLISHGVLVPVGDYKFNEYELELESTGSRELSGKVNYRVGDFYSGERWRATGKVLWKANPHFWFTGNYEYNDVTLPQGEFIVRLASVRTDIMFNAQWSWTTLAQYDNVSDSISAHSRLHWVPKAGQDFYLVFNHNLLDENEDGSFRSIHADATAKLNYTFRF